MSACSEADCDQPVRSKGLCQLHYRRARRHALTAERACPRCGKPIPPSPGGRRRTYCSEDCRRPKSDRERTTDAVCAEPDCERYPNGARGHCRPCYHRHKNAGDFGGQICTKPVCERLIYGRGLCRRHLWSAYETGELEKPACSVEGCDRPSRANKMCHRHLMRVRTHGEPGEAAARKRANGEGYIDPNGYVIIGVNGRSVGQHVYFMEQLLGRRVKRGETVHHCNGQRADNRTNGPLVNFRSGNLELWSSAQPAGQRVVDKVEFAIEILREYAPHLLVDGQ